MRVDANLEILLVFEAKNKDSCMGCYYPEDDWEIIVTASNIPDLELKATEKMVESGIIVKRAEYYSAEYLIYGDEEFFIRKVSDMDAKFLLHKIENSSYYKELDLRKSEEMEKQKAEDTIRREKERLLQLEQEATYLRNKLSVKKTEKMLGIK